MFKFITPWRGRADHFQREQAALRGEPAAALDLTTLAVIDKARIAEASSTIGTIAHEWSDVSNEIDQMAITARQNSIRNCLGL